LLWRAALALRKAFKLRGKRGEPRKTLVNKQKTMQNTVSAVCQKIVK